MLALVSLLFMGCVSANTNNTDSRGNVEVAIQDQFTEIVDLKLTRFLDNLTLLDNYSVDDYKVNVSTTGTVPVIGMSICLKEGLAFYQADIIGVVSLGGNNYEIELDTPLDYAFTIAGGCSLRDNDWAKDGSTTNLIYSVSPEGLDEGTAWDITRVILVCLGDGTSAPDPTPDLSSFFTMDALDNGIVFRRVDGTIKNIFSVRDNFHLVSETYDLSIYPTSNSI